MTTIEEALKDMPSWGVVRKHLDRIAARLREIGWLVEGDAMTPDSFLATAILSARILASCEHSARAFPGDSPCMADLMVATAFVKILGSEVAKAVALIEAGFSMEEVQAHARQVMSEGSSGSGAGSGENFGPVIRA